MALMRTATFVAFLVVSARSLLGCASILSLPNEVVAADPSNAPDGSSEAATTTDFYVDPSGGPGVFPTIGAAVATANLSVAAQKTIHVAAGTYTKASGEVFPIELRNGLSLEGAGAGVTTVRGTGLADVTSPTISPAASVLATFVVGDATKKSQIARMAIVSDGIAKTAGYEAIVCDRGNVLGTGPSSPNTIVSEVTIDGFEVGVRVTQKTLPTPSACSLLLRASVIKNGAIGAHAEGSIAADGNAHVVSIQVGGGTADGGNEFRALRMRKGEYSGTLRDDAMGLSLREGVTGVVVRGNHFVDSDIGIWSLVAARMGTATDLDIRDNDFDSLSNAGIHLWGANVVSTLSNNSFHGISTLSVGNEMAWLGVALVLDDVETPGLYPVVRSARGNTFFGNDVGIDIRTSNKQLIPNNSSTIFDFGTATDAGNNVFRCNSRPLMTVGTGGDVQVAAYVTPGVVFRLAGNVWDHAPPHVETNNQLAGNDGMDVGANQPGLDVQNATAATTPACPNGNISGP